MCCVVTIRLSDRRKCIIAVRYVLGSSNRSTLMSVTRCVVWTGDGRVFFYNPSQRTSVWERPDDLQGRGDVDKMVQGPPDTPGRFAQHFFLYVSCPSLASNHLCCRKWA